MAGKGRGVAVTKAVKAGALLAVGKPLGISKVSVVNAALLQLALAFCSCRKDCIFSKPCVVICQMHA